MDQFWSATPHELQLACDAYGKELESTQRLMAWQAINIMSPHVDKKHKHKLTVDRLCGTNKKDFATAEQLEESMRRKQEKRDVEELKDTQPWQHF